MNKKSRFLFIALSLILMFILTGCAKQTDSTNAYRLPLGESGYLSEIDFELYKKKDIIDEYNAVVDRIDYDYIVENQEYTVTMNAKVVTSEKLNYEGKAFKLTAGYYENKVFKPVNDGSLYTLTSEWSLYTYNFTLDSLAVENKDSLVLKLSYGTSIDEEKYIAENPDAKTKDIDKYRKQYRDLVDFKINALDLAYQENTKDLLSQKTINGDTVLRQNNDLHYFNTGTVTHVTDQTLGQTLTLTLNSKTGLWQWIVKTLGQLLAWLTKICGGAYWLGLLIFTLLLRTVGWPIYAKSNNFSANMSKVQPEMDRINKKYEGKTDQNSKMKQQMEIREVMKKNKVSMWGCLLPFAQMPIFFAVYQVVQRFPLTPIYSSEIAGINYKFLWTTFATEYGETSGHWALAIIVGLTMIGQQLLSTYMTKRIQRQHQNFYTKNQSTAKAGNQMMVMMVVMTVMMVIFAWRSSGISFYWIIGNIYTLLQTFISKMQQERREEKERLSSGKVRGRD